MQPLSSSNEPTIVPCVHSWVIVPASKSFWPIPKRSDNLHYIHKVCLKCQVIEEILITDTNGDGFTRCVGCYREECERFRICEPLVAGVTSLLDWVAGFHKS